MTADQSNYNIENIDEMFQLQRFRSLIVTSLHLTVQRLADINDCLESDGWEDIGPAEDDLPPYLLPGSVGRYSGILVYPKQVPLLIFEGEMVGEEFEITYSYVKCYM